MSTKWIGYTNLDRNYFNMIIYITDGGKIISKQNNRYTEEFKFKLVNSGKLISSIANDIYYL